MASRGYPGGVSQFPPLEDAVEVDAEIGRGSFGAVHCGVFKATGEPVAIKLSVAELDGRDRDRLAREVGLLKGVSHPRLTRLLGAYTDAEGGVALVYELLQGRDLGEALADTRFALEDLVRWCGDIAEGLDALHRAGLVHRDLKPGNLFLEEDGRVRILDFGLARPEGVGATVTAEGMLLGTPEFMAPEQFEGRRATRASDLYALGCVAFHLLAGRPPFVGSPMELASAHMAGSPPSVRDHAPGVPAPVDYVLGRMLARRPEERFATAAEFADALAAGVQGEDRGATVALPRTEARFGLQKTPRARALEGRRLPAVAAAFLVLAAGIAVVAWWAPARDPDPSARPPARPAGPAPASTHPFPADYTARVRRELADLSTFMVLEDGTLVAPEKVGDREAREALDPDPLYWRSTLARLGEVGRFYRWMYEEGGRPEELPEAFLEALRETDSRFLDQLLPRPFYPFAYLRPAREPVPCPPFAATDFRHPAIAEVLPAESKGWLGEAYRQLARARAFEQRRNAELARWWGGEDLEPLSSVSTREILGWARNIGDFLSNVWQRRANRLALAEWLREGGEAFQASRYALARAAEERGGDDPALAVLAYQWGGSTSAFVRSHAIGLRIEDLTGRHPAGMAGQVLAAELEFAQLQAYAKLFEKPRWLVDRVLRHSTATLDGPGDPVSFDRRYASAARLVTLADRFGDRHLVLAALPENQELFLASGHPESAWNAMRLARVLLELREDGDPRLAAAVSAEFLRPLATKIEGGEAVVPPKYRGDLPGVVARLRAWADEVAG